VCTPVCTGSQFCCNAACTNTAVDDLNCGQCGINCNASKQVCIAGTCVANAPMPHARSKFAAATGADGKIYVFCDLSGEQSIDAYDPSTNQWTTVGTLSGPNGTPFSSYGCAAATAGSLIYLATGMIDGGSATGGFYQFDPATATLTQLAFQPAPISHSGSAMTAGADGQLYLVGGFPITGDLQIYNPDAGTWTFYSSGPETLPETVGGLAAATDLDGGIYAMGGAAADTGGPYVSSVFHYAGGAWSSLPSLNDDGGLAELGAALGADGRIYAMGGQPDGGGATFIDAQAYLPGASAWTVLPNLPTPRWLVAAAPGLSGRRIYVLGGVAVGGIAPSTKVEAWDIDAGKWIP
jgi:hypothetical protein